MPSHPLLTRIQAGPLPASTTPTQPPHSLSKAGPQLSASSVAPRLAAPSSVAPQLGRNLLSIGRQVRPHLSILSSFFFVVTDLFVLFLSTTLDRSSIDRSRYLARSHPPRSLLSLPRPKTCLTKTRPRLDRAHLTKTCLLHLSHHTPHLYTPHPTTSSLHITPQLTPVTHIPQYPS